MNERQVFVVKRVEGKYGKSPSERKVEELIQYGIVNIDKPKGPTKV